MEKLSELNYQMVICGIFSDKTEFESFILWSFILSQSWCWRWIWKYYELLNEDSTRSSPRKIRIPWPPAHGPIFCKYLTNRLVFTGWAYGGMNLSYNSIILLSRHHHHVRGSIIFKLSKFYQYDIILPNFITDINSVELPFKPY